MSFDLKTHIRDPKTGKTIRENPYRAHISKEGTFFEREGKLYTPDGVFVRDVKAAPKKNAVSQEPKKA